MKYIAHRRFKDRAICGDVNIPANTECEERNGIWRLRLGRSLIKHKGEKEMKRIITFLFALVMIFALATPALAVTPPMQVPNLPKIPEIKFDFKFPDGFWDKYWKEHPLPDIEITDSTETEPEETEPEETEPEVTELEAPVIIKSQFYHGRYQRLQIEWDAVEGAENYEVLITRADGEIIEYTTESTIIYDGGAQCPRVYVDKTNDWASATVKVRAVCGDVVSEWSEEKKVGCDMLHNF